MMRQDTSSVDSVVAGVQGGVDDLTISTPTPTTTLPPCPGGLFNFPEGTMEVTDADEEVGDLMNAYIRVAVHDTPIIILTSWIIWQRSFSRTKPTTALALCLAHALPAVPVPNPSPPMPRSRPRCS